MPQNIREVKIEDADYPAQLREIPFPPKKISVLGGKAPDSALFPKSKHYLSIVGTRRNSAYGEEILREIISCLAPFDFTVVSGLATGIDAIAHKASLENNIPTIAVLGSGLSPSVFYPKQNVRLAEEITSRGGLLISEYDYDMKAAYWSFPQRNRIISGLSSATLVVEAPERSGALVTARFALDQNRDVLAIPGSAFFQNSRGTNKLIKEGAALIENTEDILKIYGIELGGPTAKRQPDHFDLSPQETIIQDCLNEPLDIDSLIRKSKMSSSEAQAIIGLMEIRGIIKKVGSDYIRIT